MKKTDVDEMCLDRLNETMEAYRKDHNPQSLASYAIACHSYGEYLYDEGRLEEAEKYLTENWNIRKKFLETGFFWYKYIFMLSIDVANQDVLPYLYEDTDRLEDAIDFYAVNAALIKAAMEDVSEEDAHYLERQLAAKTGMYALSLSEHREDARALKNIDKALVLIKKLAEENEYYESEVPKYQEIQDRIEQKLALEAK